MRKAYLLSQLSTSIVKKLLSSIVLLGGYANAHADCKSVIAGEDYCMGTEFDTADSTVWSFDDLNSYFADYGIFFSEGSIKTYTIGRDVESFFGQIPDMDVQNGMAGKNSYMFIKGPINGSLFQLKFPAFDVVGKTYLYKMRAYIQLDGQCDGRVALADANIKAHVQNQPTWDLMEVYAYNGRTSELIGMKDLKGTDEAVYIKDIIGIDSLTSQDLIRLEFVFYGSFSSEVNGLEYFVLSPYFEQFNCTKMAIDFIGSGYKYETICMSDYVGCTGDVTTVHAAGFPRNAKIEWFKQDEDSSWIAVGNEIDQSITVEKGVIPYKLRATIENIQVVEFGFKVAGKECTDVDVIDATDADAIVNVYSVDGAILKSNVKLSEALIDLKKGLYIVGDKKVYVSE